MEDKNSSQNGNRDQIQGTPNYMVFGMMMGVAIGAAIGMATDNFTTWLPIGVAMGVALGAGMNSQFKAVSGELDDMPGEDAVQAAEDGDAAED